MEYGYPTVADVQDYLDERGVELPDEWDSDWYNEWKKSRWSLLNMVDWVGPLGVWLPSATTFNVRGGSYRWGGEIRTYTPSTAVDPTDNDTTYIWLTPANAIGSGIDGDGWPATSHIQLAEIDVDSDGVITAIRDLRGKSFLQAAISETADGITTGPVACKRIASAELEALLDTGTNNLFAVNAGDMILKIVFCTKTAAGGACTVDIGFDEAADGASADTNGWIEAANANAAGQYSTENDTYDGAYVLEGGRAADDDGYVTITSSSDQSSSSFVGGAIMFYIPA